MKKSLAALSASVLGLGSAVTAMAMPAAAADTTEPCADFQQQFDATGSITDNWFQDCVPQYGLGKAEFTIVPSEDNPSEEFPEDFAPLSSIGEESPITVTSTLDTEAIGDYFNESVGFTSPILPIETLAESAASQTYLSGIAAPIATIGTAVGADVPAAVAAECNLPDDPTYQGWVATYEPIDTTFSQEIDGEDWSFTITGQPKPTYFFVSGGESWFCVTDGEETLSDVGGSESIVLFAVVMPYIPGAFGGPVAGLGAPIDGVGDLEAALGQISPAELGESGLQTLGIFERDGAVAPLVPAKPQLAATGSDGNGLVLPAVIVGGVVLLGGALVAVSVVRKRRKDEPAVASSAAAPTEPGESNS